MGKPGRIVWNQRNGAAANAHRQLPRLVGDYFAAVRQALATDPPPEKLHPIRLASKKLRYTLELFRECYGPGLETRLKALQQLQQALGEVNDCTAALRLIQKISPESPTRRRSEEFLRRRAARKAAELRKEWHEVFDAPGREKWWTAYLGK
jgi:CHAD domain-containing protein